MRSPAAWLALTIVVTARKRVHRGAPLRISVRLGATHLPPALRRPAAARATATRSVPACDSVTLSVAGVAPRKRAMERGVTERPVRVGSPAVPPPGPPAWTVIEDCAVPDCPPTGAEKGTG